MYLRGRECFVVLLSRNQLKWFAFMTMILDHVGAILFPSVLWLRLVGRLSFPLFAYLSAKGMHDTRAPEKMILRLLLFAFISQPIFSLAFGYSWKEGLYAWNIFLTLSMGALSCWSFSRSAIMGVMVTTALCLLSETILSPDYRSYGILMILFFYFISDPKTEILYKKIDPFGVVLLSFISFAALFGLTLFACMTMSYSVLQLAACLSCLLLPPKEKKEKPIGKWVYTIYPCHLLVLWLLKMTIFEGL